MRVPGRERQPRDEHENFYWLQEDYVREASAAADWTFTIWRPQLIVGPNHGVAMNLPPIIGAYAAIRRHEGLGFSFPGRCHAAVGSGRHAAGRRRPRVGRERTRGGRTRRST